MKRFLASLALGCLLGSLAPDSETHAAQANLCAPDLTAFSRLESVAKQKGSLAVTAKSALEILRREGLPTSGYYISKSASSGGKGKLAYHLYHESGFRKPCVIGNQSGMDGVLVVDAVTHEVERMVLDQ